MVSEQDPELYERIEQLEEEVEDYRVRFRTHDRRASNAQCNPGCHPQAGRRFETTCTSTSEHRLGRREGGGRPLGGALV